MSEGKGYISSDFLVVRLDQSKKPKFRIENRECARTRERQRGERIEEEREGGLFALKDAM